MSGLVFATNVARMPQTVFWAAGVFFLVAAAACGVRLWRMEMEGPRSDAAALWTVIFFLAAALCLFFAAWGPWALE